MGDVRPVPLSVKVSGKDHLLQRVPIMGMASDDSEVGLALRDLCAGALGLRRRLPSLHSTKEDRAGIARDLMKPHVDELRPTVGK